MLTLAPVVCIIAGIALSEMFKKIGESIRHHMMSYDEETPDENDNPSKIKPDKKPIEAKPQSTKQKAKMTKEQRK
jgi:hypothetical protein